MGRHHLAPAYVKPTWYRGSEPEQVLSRTLAGAGEVAWCCGVLRRQLVRKGKIGQGLGENLGAMGGFSLAWLALKEITKMGWRAKDINASAHVRVPYMRI